MRKIIFPKKNFFLGDLGIYPDSPSYSLTTFNEATILTVFNFNSR